MNLNNQDRSSQYVILSEAKDLWSRRMNRSANRSFASFRMTDKVKLHHHVLSANNEGVFSNV
jgi:hypothetical protein